MLLLTQVTLIGWDLAAGPLLSSTSARPSLGATGQPLFDLLTRVKTARFPRQVRTSAGKLSTDAMA